MTPAHTARHPFQSGCDLWIVEYASPQYQQFNWWNQFLFSKMIDIKKLRQGQIFLASTRKNLPNRWTLIFSDAEKNPGLISKIHQSWVHLRYPKTRFFCESLELRQNFEQLWPYEIAQNTVEFYSLES